MADDFLFLTKCPEELQVMFNLGHEFAGERRYKTHSLKTTSVSRVPLPISPTARLYTVIQKGKITISEIALYRPDDAHTQYIAVN